MTLFLFLPPLLFAQERRGEISGQVIDAVTQEPLPGVNVVVVEREMVGAATDANGNFRIHNLEVGEYSLRVSFLGYKPVVVTNVVVSTGRSSKVRIRLEQTVLELEGVDVRADYFSRAGAISPISTASLDGAEVKRSPGAAQDMQRVVQVLPGIGNSNDQSNELIVRGGAPNENLTILDYIEIPSTNHYPNQFNSGGPINMVNVDMIEDIQFSAGGFPAQYGDKLSSVMNVTLREGDRRRTVAGRAGLHFAGFESLLEGGLAGGNGSWILSLRQSFLEVLDNVVGISALGVTAIPKYWDGQLKVVYDLSPSHKLLLNGIYGNDRIFFRGSSKELDREKAGKTDSVGVTSFDFRSYQYAYGASLKSFWGSAGYAVLTLSAFGNHWNLFSRADFTERTYNAAGELTHSTVLNSRRPYTNLSTESFVGLKYELVYQFGHRHELNAGAQVQTSRIFENSISWEPDTSRYDLAGDGVFETGPVTFPGGAIENRLGFGDASRVYLYASDRLRLTPRLTLTFGLRYDYFGYSKRGNWNPRANVSYELVPMRTRLNAAWGLYSQTQPFPLYADNRNLGYNRSLLNSRAEHYVVGIDHMLGEGLKGSAEGYFKRYWNLPVREQFIYSADPTFRSDRILNAGKRRSFGIELFLQQKQVKDFYGTMSYSYSMTRETDPRIPQLVGEYPYQYDFPHILTLVAGKIVKGTRSALNAAPFFIRYPAYLFPLADDMEISLRFRYQSGNPYTPQRFATDRQQREAGVRWTSGAWVESGEVNSARHRAYHRLDVQWISRFHFERWNMVVVVLLENLYNRANVAQYQYRSDGTSEPVYQFAFFPIIGIGVEF